MNNEPYILWFDQISFDQLPLVGGKNASLGVMYRDLRPKGINLANGFAVTTAGYRHFLNYSNLPDKIQAAVDQLDTKDLKSLQHAGKTIRGLIVDSPMPDDLAQEILRNYHDLGHAYGEENTDTAVRSSATAEDLPGASFAGQQETYLNISGDENLLLSVRKCFASLFTDRAISYRADKKFGQTDIGLSVAVQKMVRSDLAASGIAFTLDTETGFDKVVTINGVYGLGELIVQGAVTPDEFTVFKPTLELGVGAILSKTLGIKNRKMVYGTPHTAIEKVSKAEQESYCLSDDEIVTLARWCVEVEKYYSARRGRYQPMDIEWAKDGKSNQLFIVQARPETIHSEADKTAYDEYRLKGKGRVVVEGAAVGMAITTGKIRVIKDTKKLGQFEAGEILVTEITDPDWEPIMKIAKAIITERGGRTSHAAIISRELGIPCVVGAAGATKKLARGQEVTVDCSSGKQGVVYDGTLEFEKLTNHLDQIPKTKTKVMINIGAPSEAFKNHYLPVSGVGLGRLEFIINSYIKIHPKALIDYPELKKSRATADRALVKKIEALTVGESNKTAYYVNELAEGIAKIAAAFYPNPVIIRFSDFKTNEYSKLIGGERYEPKEENPMLGWRGASRYYHPDFAAAFALECQAMWKVRTVMGLHNVIPMIPFCRTVDEGKQVLGQMSAWGLDRANDKGLKIYMMAEIPSNIIEAGAFLDIFDGFSIGSNDLTQLVLGLDRDSALVAPIANEKHPAVMKMISDVIAVARAKNKYIGICGQAPSDHPDFAQFLVERGIESISLNPDTILKTIISINEVENRVTNG